MLFNSEIADIIVNNETFLTFVEILLKSSFTIRRRLALKYLKIQQHVE